VKLFIRGKKTLITIDDYMPFVSGGLIFNRKPAGNNVWGIVLEKAFAKINGNYENINFGYQAESFRILTGAPAS